MYTGKLMQYSLSTWMQFAQQQQQLVHHVVQQNPVCEVIGDGL